MEKKENRDVNETLVLMRKENKTKTRTKKIICWIVYFIAFGAILLPTNYDFDQWQLWSLILGGLVLYGVGRYEGLNNL